MEFRLSKNKFEENNAIGVNIMFGDNRVRFVSNSWGKSSSGKDIKEEDYRLKALDIINNFLSDLQFHSDIETYIIDEGILEEMFEILTEPCIRENLEIQIDSITQGGDYFEILGKDVIDKAIENIRVRSVRYGAYIVFETMIVKDGEKTKEFKNIL